MDMGLHMTYVQQGKAYLEAMQQGLMQGGPLSNDNQKNAGTANVFAT
jgi:hypothetical protein